MNMVQILHHPGQGGAEQVAFTLAEYALKNGHQVNFIFGEEGPLVDRVRKLGCRVDFIKMPSFYNPKAVKDISEYLKEHKEGIQSTAGSTATRSKRQEIS